LFSQKICEKPQVINDYEAARGIPNNLVLGKIERVIGLKLRGKEIGQPLGPPGGKK
jgi:putative transcription factor